MRTVKGPLGPQSPCSGRGRPTQRRVREAATYWGLTEGYLASQKAGPPANQWCNRRGKRLQRLHSTAPTMSSPYSSHLAMNLSQERMGKLGHRPASARQGTRQTQKGLVHSSYCLTFSVTVLMCPQLQGKQTLHSREVSGISNSG